MVLAGLHRLSLALLLVVPGAALAQTTTGSTGGDEAHSAVQPSLGIRHIVRTADGGNGLGEITMFAGAFTPNSWATADGQLLSIASATTLFSAIGFTYGGDGQTTFALPDLRGRVAVHDGAGVGLSTRTQGQEFGDEGVALLIDEIPSHTHTAGTGVTGATGGGLAHPVEQPSLGVLSYVYTLGTEPMTGPGDASAPLIGQIGMTAALSIPTGTLMADGDELAIAANTTLFGVLGSAFGGDGQTTFAIPDLRARAPMGDGSGIGLTARSIGDTQGSQETTLSLAQLPSHTHTLTTGSTDAAGSGQAHDETQPTLAVRYLIVTGGTFPSRNSGLNEPPFAGQIMPFAGDIIPEGYAVADGTVLPINGNELLFSLLGTNFGGDGRTQFALPDLRGRIPVHIGGGPGLTSRSIGEQFGSEETILVEAELPAHTHVPEPGAASLGFAAVVGLLGLRARRR